MSYPTPTGRIASLELIVDLARILAVLTVSTGQGHEIKAHIYDNPYFAQELGRSLGSRLPIVADHISPN